MLTKDFKEAATAWLNGRFIKWNDAKVHAASHSFLYGTAAFEGVACYSTPRGPALFRLRNHIERLLRSAALLKINSPYTKARIEEACADVVRENRPLAECYLRVVLGHGYGKIGLVPSGPGGDLIIMAWQQDNYLGRKARENGIRLMTSPYRRVFSNPELAAAKITGSYYASALAKAEAIEAGFDEALMLDANGFVSECAVENIFMVKDGMLVTPTTENALNGITRKSIMEIAAREGIEVAEGEFKPAELFEAQEVFVTGTSAEVTPVVRIDGRPIGSGKPGETTRKLQRIFFEAVRGKDKKYGEWLTYAVPLGKNQNFTKE